MKDIIVSFCIATFQRYEVLKELILEILSVNSNQFEIVVCDDCSTDGSIEKIMSIKDCRLKVFVNEQNVGSSQNIYESIEHGEGKYLFYINDRDNVDYFKIEKLIDLLIELEEKNVAFAKCIDSIRESERYQIYNSGEEAFLEFSCRINHPTGFIFRRDVWKKIRDRKNLFENQCFGDYPITLICAMMATKYKGAYIYGDICDVTRARIDFAKEKSGYYKNRKDKRVWYSPEVQWRELMISYEFMKKINIKNELVDKLLCKRYKEYLERVTLQYKAIISRDCNTAHYGLYVSQNTIIILLKSIQNGIYIWRRMRAFCDNEKKKELMVKINQITREIFRKHFKESYYCFLKKL